MAGTKPMPIHLAISNKVFFVFDEYYSHNILWYEWAYYYLTVYLLTKNLSYDTILGIDCFKSTYLVIDWVVCSVELTVGAK